MPLNDEHNFFFAKNKFNFYELTDYIENINYSKHEALDFINQINVADHGKVMRKIHCCLLIFCLMFMMIFIVPKDKAIIPIFMVMPLFMIIFYLIEIC